MATDDLSAYERQRLENIERNAAFLKSLGLGEGSAPLRSSAVASKKLHSADGSNSKSLAAEIRKRKRTEKANSIASPSRRSRRVQALQLVKFESDGGAEEVKDNEAAEAEADDATIRYDIMPLVKRHLLYSISNIHFTNASLSFVLDYMCRTRVSWTIMNLASTQN